MKIEIDLEEIVGDMFTEASFDHYDGVTPSGTFKEAVADAVVSAVTREVIKNITNTSRDTVLQKAVDVTQKFIDEELANLVVGKLRSGELLTRSCGVQTISFLIEERIKSARVDDIIQKHIKQCVEGFVKDMKMQYNTIFAATLIGEMSDKKMLNHDIAKLLLNKDI